MDDLVVIILTLLIAGAGIFGQIKKYKQTQPAPENDKKPEDFWDLFRQQAFSPDINAQAEYLRSEPVKPERYENDQDYQFEAKNEGAKLIKNEIKPEPSVKDIITEKKEGFSLRKAVIYSEILNRKYI